MKTHSFGAKSLVALVLCLHALAAAPPRAHACGGVWTEDRFKAYQECLRTSDYATAVFGGKCGMGLTVTDSAGHTTHSVRMSLEQRIATYVVTNLETKETKVYQGEIGTRGGCVFAGLSGHTAGAGEPAKTEPRSSGLSRPASKWRTQVVRSADGRGSIPLNRKAPLHDVLLGVHTITQWFSVEP